MRGVPIVHLVDPDGPGASRWLHALARVRVIDATNRARLFPTDVEDPGVEVESDMREVSLDLYNTTSGKRSIEELLATNLGDRIGKLFYKHEKKELGKGMGIRK